MARREDYEHWSTGLPTGSEALLDLDSVCEELGLTRGEVSRLILVTWSKARRGRVQELWGFTPSVVLAPAIGASNAKSGEEVPPPELKKRKKVVDETTAAAVEGLTFD